MAGLDHDARMPLLAWLVTLLPLAFLILFATYIPAVSAGETIRIVYPWAPSIGVSLSFVIDGLSLLFALLISGIGVIIFLYSGSYLAGHPQIGRFYLYLASFMVSMLGLVVADNLITMFVFWELTSITSYFLIGFNNEDQTARRNALQALLVTVAGGLAMLAGLVLWAQAGDSYELSVLLAQGHAIHADPLYGWILALVLIGAFTKSAQFPFHFWLPNAMAAPTPVSAYLHSATMVKGGVYLLARMHPGLGGTEAWMWSLILVGAITAVLSSVIAVRQTDLKLKLAYTTVMALGTLTMFLGADTEVALAAAMTFILVHSLYKATLFLVVGMIDHETGTRQIDAVGGLRRAMPIAAAAALLAAFSMAGFPPFFGFIGKEMMYEGALAIGPAAPIVVVAAVAANALMIGVALAVALRPFFGPLKPTPRKPHEAPWMMWSGPIVLAAGGLLFGLFPGLVDGTLVIRAAEAVSAAPSDLYLSLWHGFNLPLLLSVITTALGLMLYWRYDAAMRTVDGVFTRIPMTGDRGYDATMAGVVHVADIQTEILQSGIMRRYLLTVMAAFAILVGYTLIAKDALALPDTLGTVPTYMWPIVGLIVAATAVTVFTQSRLAAICALGTVGTAIALVFMIFGAPDVAMTQLMVEILVVVIVAIILLRLPGFHGSAHAGRIGRIRDAVVAIATGAVVTAIMLAMVSMPLDRRLTDYFEAHSVPEAHGRNIVNVILVDFRALDTFGEIAVVGIAGFACYALIRLRRRQTWDAEAGRRVADGKP
ncbi:MAG: putative monovalent cation/H+ antiporter subunit A [Rhodospirillales bacterium]|nr:MAG: putative monovalent cation/H+ antiporter subunit A [Rhodospirillales bacterium]